METTHIEQSQQNISEELSLKSIAQILVQNWALFAVIFILCLLVSVSLYIFKIPFVSSGSVIVNDTRNSSLQSLTSQFTGTNALAKLNEAKKNNSPIQKNVEFLRTTDFYLKLLQQLSNKEKSLDQTLEEQAGYEQFKNLILSGKSFSDLNLDQKISAARKLDAILSLEIKSDYQINLKISSMEKSLAFFVSKNALSVIVQELKLYEQSDLEKVKSFLTQQKELSDNNIKNLNKQIVDFQSKPENLISLSADRIGDYMSELMVKKDEIRMKISENSKIIRSLSETRMTGKDSRLYGNSGRIYALKVENDLLYSKLADVQSSISRVTSQAKALPAIGMTYDELKKKSELEFQNYKQVSENLSKIDAYELALINKFQILETPEIDKVVPALSLFSLILLSLIITQALGSLIIYLRAIWDTKYITAQQTRNIVVIDSHSLDPRVIIENSKIKFRLKSDAFQADSASAQTKKLGFDFTRTSRTVNGLDQKSDSNTDE